MVPEQLAPTDEQLQAVAKGRVQWAQRGDGPPILLYQMGKVGSTALVKALENAGLKDRTIRPHLLTRYVDNQIATFRDKGKVPPVFLYVWRALREEIQSGEWPFCKIITMVRDPLARQLSNLFQNPHQYPEILTPDGQVDVLKAEAFVQANVANPDFYRYVDTWFDSELKAFFDVDAFAHPFPAAGNQVLRGEKCDVIVVRCEDLNQTGAGAISEFLDLPAPLQIRRHHQTANRPGGQQYRALLARLTIPRSVLEQTYSSRFARHFYTDEHIEAFIHKWSRS